MSELASLFIAGFLIGALLFAFGFRVGRWRCPRFWGRLRPGRHFSGIRRRPWPQPEALQRIYWALMDEIRLLRERR